MMNFTLTHLSLISILNHSPYFTLPQAFRTEYQIVFSNFHASHFLSIFFGEKMAKTLFEIRKSSFYLSLGHAIHFSGDSNSAYINNISFYQQKRYTEFPLIISECTFNRCSIRGPIYFDGGAIFVSTISLKVTKSTFDGCYASYTGGAIRVDRSYKTIIKYCLFLQNSAGFSSGACSFNVVLTLKLNSTNFTSCSSLEKISVTSIYNCDIVVMKNVLSIKNNAPSLTSWYTNGGDIVLTDCQFFKEKALNVLFGELFATATVQGCEFYDNAGFAIKWRADFPLTCIDCVFDTSYERTFDHYRPNMLSASDCQYLFAFNDDEINLMIPQTLQMTPTTSLLPTMKREHRTEENVTPFELIQPYIIVQNLPGNDEPEDDEKMTDTDFAVFSALVLLLIGCFRFYRRKKYQIKGPASLHQAKAYDGSNIKSPEELELSFRE